MKNEFSDLERKPLESPENWYKHFIYGLIIVVIGVIFIILFMNVGIVHGATTTITLATGECAFVNQTNTTYCAPNMTVQNLTAEFTQCISNLSSQQLLITSLKSDIAGFNSTVVSTCNSNTQSVTAKIDSLAGNVSVSDAYLRTLSIANVTDYAKCIVTKDQLTINLTACSNQLPICQAAGFDANETAAKLNTCGQDLASSKIVTKSTADQRDQWAIGAFAAGLGICYYVFVYSKRRSTGTNLDEGRIPPRQM